MDSGVKTQGPPEAVAARGRYGWNSKPFTVSAAAMHSCSGGQVKHSYLAALPTCKFALRSRWLGRLLGLA